MSKNKPVVEVGSKGFCITCDENTDMDAVCDLMTAAQDQTANYIHKLAGELGVDESVAGDIWYLRTRSRWKQELDDQIVAAAKSGNPIDSGSILSGDWPQEHENLLENLREKCPVCNLSEEACGCLDNKYSAEDDE